MAVEASQRLATHYCSLLQLDDGLARNGQAVAVYRFTDLPRPLHVAADGFAPGCRPRCDRPGPRHIVADVSGQSRKSLAIALVRAISTLLSQHHSMSSHTVCSFTFANVIRLRAYVASVLQGPTLANGSGRETP
jgi:hypothetical protein